MGDSRPLLTTLHHASVGKRTATSVGLSRAETAALYQKAPLLAWLGTVTLAGTRKITNETGKIPEYYIRYYLFHLSSA